MDTIVTICHCHILNKCFSDVADISCHPASFPTKTDTLGKTKSDVPHYICTYEYIGQNNAVSNNVHSHKLQ